MHSPHHKPSVPPAEPGAAPERLAFDLPDAAATLAAGAALAPALIPGLVIWLDGDLGSGKTTLVRGLLRGFGYVGPVKSPTYDLVEVYVVSNIYLYHFDFYRFNEPGEFDDAGLGEYFRKDSVCLAEWPDKAAGHLPAADLVLRLRMAGNDPEAGRHLELIAASEAGRQCLTAFRNLPPDGA